MRQFTMQTALAALAAALPAQESAPPAPPASANELVRQFLAARSEWNREYRAASQGKDQGALERLRAARPRTTFAAQFQAGAQAHAGTSEAVGYLVWLVSNGPIEIATESMVTLIADHVADPGIRLAVARIGGLKSQFGIERSKAWLDTVLEHNRDPHVLAQARYTRAAMYVGTRAAETSAALREKAIDDLESARTQIADTENAASLLGLIERLLDEARRLEPGCKAPEIAGEDLDGVTFKLSDYRGKVVLLDFWGDW